MPVITTRANASATGYGAFLGAAASTAFESIATATGTGSSDTITFSTIPSTYQHLQIRALSKNTRSVDSNIGSMRLRLNGDTGANYTYHIIYGDGSAALASGGTGLGFAIPGNVPGSGGNANTMAVTIIDIGNYASTTQNKTIRCFNGVDQNVADTAKNVVNLASGLWLNTDAVTSISLSHGDGNWTTNSTFALYGIKGA